MTRPPIPLSPSPCHPGEGSGLSVVPLLVGELGGLEDQSGQGCGEPASGARTACPSSRRCAGVSGSWRSSWRCQCRHRSRRRLRCAGAHRRCPGCWGGLGTGLVPSSLSTQSQSPHPPWSASCFASSSRTNLWKWRKLCPFVRLHRMECALPPTRMPAWWATCVGAQESLSQLILRFTVRVVLVGGCRVREEGVA